MIESGLECVSIPYHSIGGIRMFKESDVEFLKIIHCLKKAGVSISGIREFIGLLKQGDSTIAARLAFFQREKSSVLQQIAELKKTLEILEFKCWFYTQAQKEGTTRRLASLKAEKLPEYIASIESCAKLRE